MSRITDKGVKATLSWKLAQLPPGPLFDLAIRLPTDMPAGSSEPHAWLGSTPSMREWIARRIVQQPHAFKFAVTNRKFELGVNVPLDLVHNDKTDEVNRLLDDIPRAYGLWHEELIAALIVNAESTEAFDGQYFFDTDHSFANSGTFDNDLTYNASNENAITALEAAQAINLMIEKMKLFPDDHGRLIANRGMKKVQILFKPGTANAAAIRYALSASTLDTGSGQIDNPLKGQDVQIQAVSDGLLTLDQTKIAAIRPASDGGKPFLFQENMADQAINVLGEGNAEQYVVENDAMGVFLKAVGAAGYGLPQHGCLTTFN